MENPSSMEEAWGMLKERVLAPIGLEVNDPSNERVVGLMRKLFFTGGFISHLIAGEAIERRDKKMFDALQTELNDFQISLKEDADAVRFAEQAAEELRKAANHGR